jgi:hypothetical protein
MRSGAAAKGGRVVPSRTGVVGNQGSSGAPPPCLAASCSPQVFIEYVWGFPDGVSGAITLGSKTRVLDSCASLEDVPVISVVTGDGESVILRPRKLFADPFRGPARGYIVLCDTFAAPQVRPAARTGTLGGACARLIGEGGRGFNSGVSMPVFWRERSLPVRLATA